MTCDASTYVARGAHVPPPAPVVPPVPVLPAAPVAPAAPSGFTSELLLDPQAPASISVTTSAALLHPRVAGSGGIPLPARIPASGRERKESAPAPAAQSVARSMTDSQCASVVPPSSCATAGDSDRGRPPSCRSAAADSLEPEDARVRAESIGGQVVPLLNMAPWIGTNRASANPASSAADCRPTCAACVTCANRTMRSAATEPPPAAPYA